jgi:hypothetical protein
MCCLQSALPVAESVCRGVEGFGWLVTPGSCLVMPAKRAVLCLDCCAGRFLVVVVPVSLELTRFDQPPWGINRVLCVEVHAGRFVDGVWMSDGTACRLHQCGMQLTSACCTHFV